MVQPPTINLCDPIFVNQCSIAAIKEVLRGIGKHAGIKRYDEHGSREWVLLRCDGLPYGLIRKLVITDPEFDWVVIRSGLGHEEMNMLRAFVELYWDVVYKEFGKTQGFLTDKALSFFKACKDHHQAWDNFLKFRDAITKEIATEYIKATGDTAGDTTRFLDWISASSAKDATFEFIVEILIPHAEALCLFRYGVRHNIPSLISKARHMFMTVWFGRRHPKYRAIVAWEEYDRACYPEELRCLLEASECISRSGRHDNHQGLDFILEEYNRDIKGWIIGASCSDVWTRVIRNFDGLNQLRNMVFDSLVMPQEIHCKRTRPSFAADVQTFCILVRRQDFVCPIEGRGLVNIRKVPLHHELKHFDDEARKRQEIYTDKFLITRTMPDSKYDQPIFVTKEEVNTFSHDKRKAASTLQNEIKALIDALPLPPDSSMTEDLKDKLNSASENKSELIQLLYEVRGIAYDIQLEVLENAEMETDGE